MLRKTLSLESAELKFSASAGTFSGYASTFNGVDSYGDTIIPGAYKQALRAGLPKMLFNHSSYDLPIGKWLSAKEDERGLFVEGELTPGNPQSDAVHAALKHGTVDGLSIGYYLKSGDYEETDTGRTIKKISRLVEISVVTFPADGDALIVPGSIKSMHDMEAGLMSLQKAITIHMGHLDGSIPTSDESQQELMSLMVEAYTMISGDKPEGMKSVGDIASPKDFERFLRYAGVSRGVATALVARAKQVLLPGDRDADSAFTAIASRLQCLKLPN